MLTLCVVYSPGESMAKYVPSDKKIPYLNPDHLPRQPLASCSVSSVYSADGGQGDYKISGSVLLSISYKQDVLSVYVNKALELVGIKQGGYSDPYVKVYLLPDPSGLTKRRTAIQNRTNNPVLNETLTYNIDSEDVIKKILWVSIWDWDMHGRNLFLGEIHVPLIALDLSNPNEKMYPLNTRPFEAIYEYKGKIYFSIMYDVTKWCLNVTVKKGMELRRPNLQDRSNCFIRVLLLPDIKPSSKMKTKLFKYTSNPVWNEKFSYVVSREDLCTSRVLEISLWYVDKGGFYNFIGCVRVGPAPLETNGVFQDWMDSYSFETACWAEMLARPGKWIKTWLNLRPSISSRFAQHYRWSLYESDKSNTATSVINNENVRDYTITGRLLVNLRHVNDILNVTIYKARNLASIRGNKLSNPYLKVYLLIGRRKILEWMSEAKKHTLNPVFNETLQYEIDYSSLLDSVSLQFSFWDDDEHGKSNFLGEVEVNPSFYSLAGYEHWYDLVDKYDSKNARSSEVGLLYLGLKFIAKNLIDGVVYGKLIVEIIKADELPKREGSFVGTFVKAFLLPNYKQIKQTRVEYGGCSLYWLEELNFKNIAWQDLCNKNVLELTVWEKTVHKTVQFIGGLRIGCTFHQGRRTEEWKDSTCTEAEHWEEMIKNPGEFVVRCHAMRSSMQYRTTASSRLEDDFSSITPLELSTSPPKNRGAHVGPTFSVEDNIFIGEVSISVMFEMTETADKVEGNLHVKVKEPKMYHFNIKSMFANCEIFPRNSSNINPKVIKEEENVNWGHMYVYQNLCPYDLLIESVLEISFWEKSAQSENAYLIGRVRLGPDPEFSDTKSPWMDCSKKESQHWQSVFNSPGTWIENLHRVRL